MHVTILVRLTDNMQTCTPAQNEIKEICFWLENKFTNSFTLKGRFWLHCRSAGWEQVVSGNGDAMFTSAMSQIIQSNRSSTCIVSRWWWLHEVDSSLQRSCLQDNWRRRLLTRHFPQYYWTHASGVRGELDLMDVLFIKPSIDLFAIGKQVGMENFLLDGVWGLKTYSHQKMHSGEKFPRNPWPECLLEHCPQWLQMHITLWPSRCWRTGSKVTFRQEAMCDVSDLIIEVLQSMFYCKLFIAHTLGWQSIW